MKKFLSALVAVSVIASTFVCSVSAANTSRTVTANDFSVSQYGNLTGPSGFEFQASTSSPQYGSAIAAKKEAVYGLSQGEYGIEMIAGKQKVDQPYLGFNFGDIDASEDFYITTNAYIGMQPKNDFVRLGTKLTKEDKTELKNGDNFQGYKFFQGGGAVRFVSNVADGNTSKQNASYTTNNWVNYTIAGTGGEIAVYVDGVKFDTGWVAGISGGNKTVSYSGILKNVTPAIRFDAYSSSNLGDVPSIAVFKEMKLVAGTYDPQQSKTTITSSKYTVPSATLLLGSSATNITNVKPVISGVSEAETAAEFLSNITVPSGASKSVVRINPTTKATTVVGNSENMSSDMKLLVRSSDGSMKLYTIKAGLSGLLYFDAAGYTESGYSINDADRIITVMPHTTVETLTGILNARNGASYMVVRKDGEEYLSGALTNQMKVVVSKNGKSIKYSIAFKDTNAFTAGSKLGTVADDTVVFSANGMSDVFDYSGKGLLGINHSSNGYTQFEKANAKVTPAGTYTVTKVNMPGHSDTVSTWHFTEEGNSGGWRKHSSNALGLQSATASSKGKKTIITFKARLASGGGLSIALRHAYGTKPDCTDIQYLNTSNTGHGDRITFANGNISLGGQNRDWSLSGYGSNYKEDISTYSNDTEYDVVLIESRGTKTEDGTEYQTIVTEAVYVNGTNVLGSHKSMTIKDGRNYFAIRDITLQTVGEVYLGGLRIYMADEYSIPEAGVDDGVAPADEEETDDEEETYTWTPDSIAETEIFAPENEIVIVTDEITNYYGTVGTLKDMLDSDLNTKIEVVNGNTAAATVYSDNQALAAGMYVRISDVNDEENCTYYRLTTAISTDMRVEALSMKKVEEYITATRVIKTYRTESDKKAKLIATTYDANGKLTDISVDEKDISSADTYKFQVGVNEGATTKIMLWLDDMEPYDAATPYPYNN